MRVRRVVTDLTTPDPAQAHTFYADVLGLRLAMDMGWIRTYVADDQPSCQVTVLAQGGSGAPAPQLTMEVDDLDEAIRRVRAAGLSVVYGPVVEPWGVRRFFADDGAGHLVNVMSHRPGP